MRIDWLTLFNSFIEDTCVVVTVAWGMTRVKGFVSFLGGESPDRRSLLGIVFGLLATSEVIFPGARSPYVFHTLIVCLAQFIGGPVVAMWVVAVATLAAVGIHGMPQAVQTASVLVAAGVVTEAFRRLWRGRQSPILVGIAGGVAQGVGIMLGHPMAIVLGTGNPVENQLPSMVANAFGLMLVMLVWNDAKTRTQSEMHRLEAEHLRVLLLTADFAALKARIRPHFLFNSLAAISALCDLDPKRAQSSIQKISLLMRRHIEVDSAALVSLDKELEYIRTYVEIQQLRFGKRVACEIDIEGEPSGFGVPAFSLQTLVENAFQHGVERRAGPSRINVCIHCRGTRAMLSVRDDGPGMEAESLSKCIPQDDPPTHGLAIADRQLRIMFGSQSRLRIFSEVNHGTLVIFKIGTRRSD